MKRRSTTLTTLTIALAGAFLLGCQEQGPTQATLDDIPPDFTPGFAKGGKGGGGADILMTATGGIETPPLDPPQLGRVITDNRKRLFIEMGLIESKLDFQAALAAFGAGDCVNPSGDSTGLAAYLTDWAGQDGDDDGDGYGTRVVNISFDRRTGRTDENRIFTLGGGGVRVILDTGSLPSSSPLTVAFVDDNDGDSVTGEYTYSDGVITAERMDSGPPSDAGRLVCPNGDDVVITLTRP